MSKSLSRKINVISLGCAKNLVDAEKLMGSLSAAGYEILFEAPEPCPIVIINTCGFINDAKEESVDTILQNAKLKKQGHVSRLIVMGCLSQRYRTQLLAEITEIDAIFGVNEAAAIRDYLEVQETTGEQNRILTTPPHYAWLKIAEGCNRRCAFCAIPKIRGKQISTPLEDIMAEAQGLAQSGVKELLVIAQDTTAYGTDIYHKKTLALVLKGLSLVQGIDWIRLHYTYPASFPQDVLNLMASEPKLCKYVDIPLQHISTKVLKSMNRGIDKEKTIQLIHKIRKTVPGVVIRTSFIVGYPNETEKDFAALYQFVEEMRFDRVGVFMYSHEENTPAFKLGDKVPARIKEKRFKAIMELQQQISQELNTAKHGQQFRVIIDSKNGDTYSARTAFDSPEVDNEVQISSKKKLQIGNFYTVRILDSDAYTLFAEIV